MNELQKSVFVTKIKSYTTYIILYLTSGVVRYLAYLLGISYTNIYEVNYITL